MKRGLSVTRMKIADRKNLTVWLEHFFTSGKYHNASVGLSIGSVRYWPLQKKLYISPLFSALKLQPPAHAIKAPIIA